MLGFRISAKEGVNECAASEGQGILGVDAGGLVVVLDGTFILTQVGVGVDPVAVAKV